MDSQQKRLKNRADFVTTYVESAEKKGVKVAYSVNILSNKILFLSERQIYKDLERGRNLLKEHNTGVK